MENEEAKILLKKQYKEWMDFQQRKMRQTQEHRTTLQNSKTIKNWYNQVKFTNMRDGSIAQKGKVSRPENLLFLENVVIYYDANNLVKKACYMGKKRKESQVAMIPLVVGWFDG